MLCNFYSDSLTVVNIVSSQYSGLLESITMILTRLETSYKSLLHIIKKTEALIESGKQHRLQAVQTRHAEQKSHKKSNEHVLAPVR